MAVSTVLGPLVGIVSWRMRVGDYRESAALVGLVFALCSAQGLHMLLFETNWLWLDGFGAHRLLFAALTIAVAALAAGYLTLSRRLAASWASTSAVLSSVLGLPVEVCRADAGARVTLGPVRCRGRNRPAHFKVIPLSRELGLPARA